MIFQHLAKTSEIPSGERKRFIIGDLRITVFNIGDEYFAILDTCPHKKTAPLLRGTLDGEGIRCPNHGYRFDLRTGVCDVGERWNTRVFPLKIEDGNILVNLDKNEKE
ncbi:MAG: Rieske (2Fe-2S) protein [Nitrospina sp.]|nr:Rieske (2Fe-2S) protein [Nitrospina sp.]